MPEDKDIIAEEEKEARDWEERHPGRSNDPRDEYVGLVPDSWLRD